MTNQYLEELSKKQGVDFRAPVPEGTELGREQIEPGAEVVHHKNKSMVHAAGKPLPEREALYDLLRHDKSMVPPTIAQARMARHPGRFTTIEPPGWHDNDPEPIEETCEICFNDPERIDEQMRLYGSVERPKFQSMAQLRRHYQLSHEMEWNDIEADRRDKERRDEAGRMERLVFSLVSALAPSAADKLSPEVREQITELQSMNSEFICDECGKACANQLGLNSHKRSHRKDGG